LVQTYFSGLIVVLALRRQIYNLAHYIVVDREDWLQSIHEELMTPFGVMLFDEALFEAEIDSAPVNLGLLIDDHLPRESVVRHCRVEWFTL